MAANFTEILNHITIRVPGAAAPAIDLELGAVLDEFFSNSNCWVEAVPVITVVGKTDYEVESINGDFSRLMNVVDANGMPISGWWVMPNTLRLQFAPDKIETLYANIALMPSDTNRKDIPEWVIGKYWLEIIDGVLARLMSEPAKPYTNDKLAMAHYAKFRGGIAEAKREALRTYRFRGQDWRFPQAFATRRKR